MRRTNGADALIPAIGRAREAIKDDADEEWLTRAECGRWLKVGLSSIDKMVKAGLPAAKSDGRFGYVVTMFGIGFGITRALAILAH